MSWAFNLWLFWLITESDLYKSMIIIYNYYLCTNQTPYFCYTFTQLLFYFHILLSWHNIFSKFHTTLMLCFFQFHIYSHSFYTCFYLRFTWPAVIISLIYQSSNEHYCNLYCSIVFLLADFGLFLIKLSQIYLWKNKFWYLFKFIFLANKLLCGLTVFHYATIIFTDVFGLAKQL